MDNIPVYLFSGLIDSGKTSCIKETLYDPAFNEGEKTLIIITEEGDVEFDIKFLKLTFSELVVLDSISELTIKKMEELDKQYEPERVFIEINGMADERELYAQGFYEKWEIAQHLCLIDASTFRNYVTNMKQFIYNHVLHADLCVFNRADKEDKKYLRNNIKGINPKLQIVYENSDGIVTDKIDDNMFDPSKPLTISDDDFGLWYMDSIDNPDKYKNAEITLKLRYLEPNPDYDTVVYMGRNAMVCCSNDVAPVGIAVCGVPSKEMKVNSFYEVHGKIKVVKANGEKTCVLYADTSNEVEAMADELVYFN